MTEIEAIYEEFYSDKRTKSEKDYIAFYETNKTIIEGTDTSSWSIDAVYIANMTCDYALSLSYYGSSRKSIPYLSKAIELFENLNESDFLAKESAYETLRWVRGYENHNQKNYMEAAKDFKYLVDNYPDNDKYKNWLSGSYETFHWARGKENYDQKNYAEASKDFKYLVKNYPDNETYKKWLVASLTITARRVSNFAWAGVVALVIIYEIAKMKEASLNTRIIIDMFSLVFFIVIIFVAVRNYLIKHDIYRKKELQ